jgi:DNA-binding response OmpR family regulator
VVAEGRVRGGRVRIGRLSTSRHTFVRKDIYRRRFPAATVAVMSALAIAEPEAASRGVLVRRLSGDGFEVVAGAEPSRLVERVRRDLVLLGDAAALERWSPSVPTIVLGTPEARAGDRVRALRNGCDDGPDRPFDSPELLERIRAVLRRTAAPERDDAVLEAGPVRIDPRTRRVTVAGQRVLLAQKEYELLLCLAREPERVFTKAELLQEIWDYRSIGRTRTLDSHASRVRRKLREAGARVELVDNVWGVGYRLLGAMPTE